MGVPNMEVEGGSDPYVLMNLSDRKDQIKTNFIKNTKYPKWNEEFHMNLTSSSFQIDMFFKR
jgi:Ca2+-dependent lipid-binding protein